MWFNYINKSLKSLNILKINENSKKDENTDNFIKVFVYKAKLNTENYYLQKANNEEKFIRAYLAIKDFKNKERIRFTKQCFIKTNIYFN